MNKSLDFINRKYPLYLFAPGFLVFTLFFLLPFAFSAYYSFTVWDFFSAKFVGFLNYSLAFDDSTVLNALKNTLLFTVITALVQTAGGMLLALFVNRVSKIVNILRTVIFMPIVLNTVAIGIIMSGVLHSEAGVLNRMLRAIGLEIFAKDWFGDPGLAIYSVCFVNIWRWAGFAMIVLLAGIQSVPKEYYEAAVIDGAGPFRKFLNVTFPLIMPSFNNLMVVTLIGSLKVFDIVMVTTRGGPGGASEVLNTIVFKNFGLGLQGLANAQTIILSAMVIAVSFSAYLIGRRKEVDL